MKDNFQHVWDKLKEVYGRMELRQRLMIAILLAVTFGIIIWMISWSARVEYALLFGRLDAENAHRTMTSLREMNIPFRLRDEGRSIFIPADRVHETRIVLTSEGVGRAATGIGFEIFDRTTLGTTEFVQRSVNWRRAMEGEMQRSIMSLSGVEYARVHLVFPEDRLFREDQREPSASVILRLSRRLAEHQIQGIVNFIASGIEGLDPLRITIVDQDGRVLNEEPDDSIFSRSDQQMSLQSQIETTLMGRAQSMLDRSLGADNSIVLVSATLNFDQVESTSEIFDPEGQVVRSEEIQSQNIVSLTDSMSNISEHLIVNYEISTTVQRRVNSVGDIRRLTVAVSVNHRTQRRFENGRETIDFIERSPEELAQLESLVRNAVGFDERRGDQISVHSILFDRADVDFMRAEQDRQERVRQYIALAEKGAVIVVLIVLLFILTSQLKKIFAPPTPEEEILEDALRPAFAEGSLGAEGFYPEGDEGMPMGDGKISYTLRPMKDIAIEQTEAMLLQEAIQKFVLENPDVTVKLIKSWLMDTGEYLKN